MMFQSKEYILFATMNHQGSVLSNGRVNGDDARGNSLRVHPHVIILAASREETHAASSGFEGIYTGTISSYTKDRL